MRESGAQIACRWGWGGDFCISSFPLKLHFPTSAEFGRSTPITRHHRRWEWRFLQGRHRLQIGRGSALFCVSLSAKNRMVQAPKSWYNRYKSYGAPGQKTCAKTLPFREIVPAKYVTLFHVFRCCKLAGAI